MSKKKKDGSGAVKAFASVKLLGGFELRIDDAVVDETLTRSGKMWGLLSYIVMQRDRAVPQMEFVEVLWPYDDSGNPVNALKTLLYRTRMTIGPILDESIELIVSQRGAYSWNRNIECELDVEIFEQLCREVEADGLTQEQKLDIYRRIYAIYRGDFLPKLTDMIWVVTASAHYHNMYLSAIKSYTALLDDLDMYDEMNEVCSGALQIDPYDEQLHYCMILSLLQQGNSAAALSHYNAATELLYRNLGIKPSEKLRGLYLEIMRNDSRVNPETDVDTILGMLRDAANEPGAFICDPGFFTLAYRLEARRAARNGSSVHIALLTVSTVRGDTPSLKILDVTMSQLLDAIKAGLRKGDIASRYSGSQYVLMLPSANFEDGQTVVSRILRIFFKRHPRNSLKISHRLFQLEIAN
jgi:DNA-binding SARP family transcriptional activator